MLYRLLLLLLLFLSVHAVPAGADVSSVRVVGDGAPTRITVWTDTREEGEAYLVEEAGEQKILLVLGQNAYSAEGRGTGGVVSWRLNPGRLEFVLDRPMSVMRVLRLPPTGSESLHRVIIDLDTISQPRFASLARRDARRLAADQPGRSAGQRALAAAAPISPPAAAAGHVIVIDAGHGGRDPGAVASDGTREKDITLRAAVELRDLLQADGRYQVRLTRDTDRFIELEDRVTMARDWGAELFISLHADAAASPDVAGASVYTISARGETRIDQEASRNNWVMPIEDGTPEPVTGILSDLIKRETRTRSSEFAEMLLPELAGAGPVLRNSHRNAGFYVLLAPDVPAVLLELGFLTNSDDSRRLKSDRGRQAAIRATKRAIDAYFERQDMRLAAQ